MLTGQCSMFELVIDHRVLQGNQQIHSHLEQHKQQVRSIEPLAASAHMHKPQWHRVQSVWLICRRRFVTIARVTAGMHMVCETQKLMRQRA